MSDKERPLPQPPKTPFGSGRAASEQGSDGLLSERMAEAALQGKLDEFLRAELPDSEQARALAKMMMGMTGMMPADVPVAQREETPGERATERRALSMPPEEVLKAVQGGDVKGLMDLLRQEHQRRSPDAAAASPDAGPEPPSMQPAGGPQAAIDKDLIDSLIRIAAENNVTVDWLILRAVKVYVEEHRRTGKL